MISQDMRPPFAATIVMLVGSSAWWYRMSMTQHAKEEEHNTDASQSSSSAVPAIAVDDDHADDENNLSVLACIRNRRSVFPREYLQDPPPLDDAIIQSLLDAAIWAPFHGRCYAGCQHPAKFVVLGKQAMVEMQHMTLQYYDQNWKEVGWGAGKMGTQDEYDAWRNMTRDEITGRWAPCSHMIAIVMRRQTGPKRLPEWEEAAAVAAATQNMHLQSTKFPQLACYWSSWHDAVRDSDEMKKFLHMQDEDKCMGYFIVAQRNTEQSSTKDRRKRDKSLIEVEWRK